MRSLPKASPPIDEVAEDIFNKLFASKALTVDAYKQTIKVLGSFGGNASVVKDVMEKYLADQGFSDDYCIPEDMIELAILGTSRILWHIHAIFALTRNLSQHLRTTGRTQ